MLKQGDQSSGAIRIRRLQWNPGPDTELALDEVTLTVDPSNLNAKLRDHHLARVEGDVPDALRVHPKLA